MEIHCQVLEGTFRSGGWLVGNINDKDNNINMLCIKHTMVLFSLQIKDLLEVY